MFLNMIFAGFSILLAIGIITPFFLLALPPLGMHQIIDIDHIYILRSLYVAILLFLTYLLSLLLLLLLLLLEYDINSLSLPPYSKVLFTK